MAAFSSPRSPTVTLGSSEPVAVLMKNQKRKEKSGVRGWLGLGEGSVRRPRPSVCPHWLRATLPPHGPPHGGPLTVEPGDP